MEAKVINNTDGAVVRREYWHTMDKSDWGVGPWDEEPDKVQWTDPATGMPCLIVRNRMGALCGYVGVDRSHPWYGLKYDTGDYDEASDKPNPGAEVSVHGGLTFSSKCSPKGDDQTDEDAEANNICHVPEPGQSDDIWWFGFDTAHCDDVVPKMNATLKSLGAPMPRGFGETYRTVGYVTDEVTSMARQLKDVANGTNGF